MVGSLGNGLVALNQFYPPGPPARTGPPAERARVFFEVVQRVGGYRGFGVVNAPVRMAAHREVRQGAR
ncbi:hypothetical protein JOD27_006948 [Lentzea nigeriaca]|nr:hypothetical protein [Lentzea nigeriaca]MBM7863101.1 hypothetical protein [Lentzea nigeriaca]